MRCFRTAAFVTALLAALPAFSAVIYQSGFELSNGFGLGLLGNQPTTGWTVVTGTPARTFPIVSNLNPASGTQHLRIGRQPDLPLGELKGGFTPQLAIPAGVPVSVSIDININQTDGAEYGVAVQSIAQGLLTGFVDFSFTDNDGDMISGDILVQEGPVYHPTTFEFTPAAYKTLRIDFDPVAATLTYFYDNTQIYQQGLWSGTAIDQVVVVSDNYQFDTEFGDFDNLIVTTPATDPCASALRGDGNCDNRVDNFDIDPFVFAVVNFADELAPPGYLGTQTCWENRACWGDINRDDLQNNFDIEPFVSCILVLPPTGESCPAQ